VECGDLIVPEDRDHPEGNTIRLHVAIFHPEGEVQPDPVIYLHGGPGSGALDWFASVYEDGYQRLFPDRDVIVFDQRGAGYAEPWLTCPGLSTDYAMSLVQDQRMGLIEWEAGMIEGCREDLQAQRINLAAYTSQASAGDIHDLISVLGYDQVNFFGGSYGSFLALTYLREYGDEGQVRSVILDGVYPPQADLFADRAISAQGAFDAIFAACAADTACHAAYPDLEQVFYRLLEKFDAEPVSVAVQNPLHGLQQQVVINGHRFLEGLYRAAYDYSWTAVIPGLLYAMDAGDPSPFSQAMSSVFDIAGSVDSGVYYAVQCSGEAGFSSAEAIETQSEYLHPLVRDYLDGGSLAMLQACAEWPVAAPDPAQNEAVVSDVPVLLLSGTFDPITPPSLATLAAESLSNGYAYEFRDAAHGTLNSSPCAQEVAFAFVKNLAEPSASCLQEEPASPFAVP
jgi:pimeloyl-ACP methyl ester carboxylesterase